MRMRVLAACTQLLPRTAQADDPLSTFMDFCTYGHMIDNVVLIVTGTLHERDVQACLRHALPPALSPVSAHQLNWACLWTFALCLLVTCCCQTD